MIELLILIAMVSLGDTYHMETSQLFCDVDCMEWDLSDKLQPSESTFAPAEISISGIASFD